MQKSIKIIAEAGTNHNGILSTALEIIEVAADCGADIVKFQSFLVDDLLSSNDPNYDRMKKLEMPKEWYPELINCCNNHGVSFLSTATNFTTLKWMEEFNVSQYKVASCNITHRPLLDKLIEIGKPVIVSTGLANLDEILELAEYFNSNGFKNYSFLHCVSKYPTGPSDARLKNITFLKEKLKCKVGFSDHTQGYHLAVAAVALGAEIIEKHITLGKSDIGMDHEVAVLPGIFSELCSAIRDTEKALYADFSHDENAFLNMRRSLHFARDMSIGEIVKYTDLKIVRPEDGLPPSEMDCVMGKKLVKNVKYFQPVTRELFTAKL